MSPLDIALIIIILALLIKHDRETKANRFQQDRELGFLTTEKDAVITTLRSVISELQKSQTKLVNAVMSKNAIELRDLTMTEKIDMNQAEKPPDLIPMDQLDDEGFNEVISDQLKQ